jgi:hypothetical protein
MPTIQILVRVIQTFATEVPGPIAPGKRFVFSDDLVLERYDDSTPGSGLPQNQNQRLAGTQSGVLTIVRIAAANDRFFPANSRLVLRGRTSSTPWTTPLCRRVKSPHKGSFSLVTTTTS